MNEANLYAEAVCVEDGRITAVGPEDDVMKLRTDEDQV
ncbi:imidazolonepropionase-like domain-containing protein, partial [Sporofaciens musculi]